MMDERLYRETFSRLRASDEAKKEVLLKMNGMEKTRRPLRALRTLAIAAALTMALAVTANAASGGELFKTLRIVWQDGSSIMMEDGQGNLITVATGGYDKAEVRDGKLIVEGVEGTEDETSKSSMMIGHYTVEGLEGMEGTEVEVNVAKGSPAGVEVDTVKGAIYSVNAANGEAGYSENAKSDTAAGSPAAEDTTSYTVVSAND